MTACLTNNQNEEMRQYLEDIGQFPRLTPQQELELAQRCAQGDEDAIRQMVNSNLRLVVSVAREYTGRGVPLLDLCQEGSIGLLNAAKKFDYTKELRFSTYATKWIRQGITRYLAANTDLIRIPEHTGDQIRRLQRERSRILQETGQEPTEQALAQALDCSTEKVRKLLGLCLEICSLDVLTGKEDDVPYGNTLEDPAATEPQKTLVRQELDQILTELLSRLEKRQQTIVRLYFGLEDGVCHSLEEIAGGLQISKERARQLKNQAMEKLQSMGAGFGLEEFLDDLN